LIKRFIENQSEIAKAVSVFDTFTCPEDDLEGFGKEEITILEKYFSKCFDNVEETILMNLKKEWYEFRVVGKHLNIYELVARTLNIIERFPFLAKLTEILAVLPASTSSYEPEFSQRNLIKVKLRSSMNPSTLNDLMIRMNGPSLEDFVPDKSVDK
jgi:hypothetical protein